MLHNRHPARDGRLREGTPLGGAGAVPAATAIHRGRGRFWATSRPARDRTARCSLHWRRGGSSRLHPVIPGSAARAGTTAVERRKASGPPLDLPRKRGGEEDKARGRAVVAGSLFTGCVSRRSASLAFVRGAFLAMAWQNSGADRAARTRPHGRHSKQQRGWS
jgi:hypothetical protein